MKVITCVCTICGYIPLPMFYELDGTITYKCLPCRMRSKRDGL